MKRKLITLLIPAMMMAGCSSSKEPVTTTPSMQTVTSDKKGRAEVNVTFNVPGHSIAKRGRLFITPTVVDGDSVVEEFSPIVLDSPIFSKKLERKRVLDGYVDPYADVAVRVADRSEALEIPYNAVLDMPKGMTEARFVAVVSTDGCGICTGIDTLTLADIRRALPPTDQPMTLIEPEFQIRPKVHSGKGEARLQFIVDKWNIVMDLADNRRELTGMVNTLRPILEDSLATLTSLNIFGSASAEASYDHNVMLATNRANSARKWLEDELDIPKDVHKIIKTGASPEGWEPVVQAMIAANDPDSIKVRELMLKYPGPTDDAAEKYIRRLACWPRIRDNYLAKDRKVLYDYSWTVKSFTNDAELIEMYQKRPDSFNEDEFLRVAALAKDDDSRLIVYEKMLEYFPGNEIAEYNIKALKFNKQLRKELEEYE